MYEYRARSSAIEILATTPALDSCLSGWIQLDGAGVSLGLLIRIMAIGQQKKYAAQ
jgi:hypothetical protein